MLSGPAARGSLRDSNFLHIFRTRTPTIHLELSVTQGSRNRFRVVSNGRLFINRIGPCGARSVDLSVRRGGTVSLWAAHLSAAVPFVSRSCMRGCTEEVYWRRDEPVPLSIETGYPPRCRRRTSRLTRTALPSLPRRPRLRASTARPACH